MNKSEAINKMGNGAKLSHPYFDAHEWITITGDKVKTEEGYLIPVDEFFSFRRSKARESDWQLFQNESA